MIRNLLCLLLLCCAVTYCHAQQDSTIRKDSIHNAQLERQLNHLQQLAAERNADSLKRLALEKQVATLSTADNLKKVTLEKQLDSLQARDSLKKAHQQQQIDALRHVVKGYPIAPFRDTLFALYTRQGSFTAAERAAAVSQRIAKLTAIAAFSADSLKLVPGENTTDLVYRDQLLVSFSGQDALWQNTSRQKLALQLRSRIVNAINEHREETRWQTLLKETLFALLVIAMAWLLIFAIHQLYKRLLYWLRNRQGWLVSGIRIRNYTLLNAERQRYLFISALKIIRWCLVILVIYLALPVLFNIFPFTRDLSGILIGYVTAPLDRIALAVWAYIPNLFTILVLVFVFRLVLRLLRYLKSEVEKGELVIPGFYADWAGPTYQIIRILVMAFLLIVIFPYLPGSDSAVFKGVSVFMGVLFTFGSAGALGNVVAGLVMTYMRAFKIGDRVTIGEATGDIVEKTLLVTRIRTIQNEIISIPNSTVMNNHTVNFSSEAQERGLILHTTVTIGYDAPWRQVHELLISAALATELIEQEPKPYVLQTSLDDYYVSYRINVYTKAPNRQAMIYSQLHENIQDKFNAAGLEIMSPHYKALRDGNKIAIPDQYLPKDYTPPAFQTKAQKNNET